MSRPASGRARWLAAAALVSASTLALALAPLPRGNAGADSATPAVRPSSSGSASISSERDRVTFGRSARGRELKAIRLGDPDSERTVLVVGSIHGDEREGHEITARLLGLRRDIEGAQIWVVKTVNPDGAQANSRTNAHGVDLNRNFPVGWSDAEPPGSGYYGGPHPFSEPESRAVRRLTRRIDPRISIWYHQPWNAVLLPCKGRAEIEKRYARVAHHPTDRCRGADLPGTATRWLRRRFGGTHFVVELGPGELGAGQVRRHARAVIRVATR